jgi:hypothetical protein
MSDLDEFDLDDFELDEETLRQIEEEARRTVDEEMLNDDLLKEIEEAALVEAGLDDIELDDDILKEIEQEALASLDLDDDDFDFDEFDLDLDLDDEPAAEPVAEAPVYKPKPRPKSERTPRKRKAAPAKDNGADKDKAVERARQRALDKARGEAIGKAKRRASVKAKQVAARRSTAQSVRAEVESEKQASKMMMMVVGGCVLILAIVGILLAVLAPDSKSPTPAPSAPDNGGIVKPTKTAQEIAEEKFRKFSRDLDKRVKAKQTPDNLKAAIAEIEAYKAANPEQATACDSMIARYQGLLDRINSFSPGGQ